jgi:hypothetical protein
MTLDEAIKHFGNGNRLCRALGLTRANITDWHNKGYIPLVSQLRMERITKGILKAEDDHHDEIL